MTKQELALTVAIKTGYTSKAVLEVLKDLSYQFCRKYCEPDKIYDCDRRGVTCTALVRFLVNEHNKEVNHERQRKRGIG